MPESGAFGSARGVSGNGHPYRNPGSTAAIDQAWRLVRFTFGIGTSPRSRQLQLRAKPGPTAARRVAVIRV